MSTILFFFITGGLLKRVGHQGRISGTFFFFSASVKSEAKSDISDEGSLKGGKVDSDSQTTDKK